MSARRSARSHFTLCRKAIPGCLQCLPHLRCNLRCHRHNLQFAHCPNLAPEISIQGGHFAGSLSTNLSAIRAQIPGHHLFIYEISLKFLGYFPTSTATLCSSTALRQRHHKSRVFALRIQIQMPAMCLNDLPCFASNHLMLIRIHSQAEKNIRLFHSNH